MLYYIICLPVFNQAKNASEPVIKATIPARLDPGIWGRPVVVHGIHGHRQIRRYGLYLYPIGENIDL